MKRIILSLLTLAMLVSLCACKKPQTTSNSLTEEGTETSAASFVSESSEETLSSKETSNVNTSIKETSGVNTSSKEPGANSAVNTYIPKPKSPEVLSAEQEKQIKQTQLNNLLSRSDFQTNFPNATLNNIQIEKYYGTYNGSIALMMTDDFTAADTAKWDISVADVVFHYYNGNRIIAYKDGKFYSLQSAYEQGLLAQEDIRNIAYYQNGN